MYFKAERISVKYNFEKRGKTDFCTVRIITGPWKSRNNYENGRGDRGSGDYE